MSAIFGVLPHAAHIANPANPAVVPQQQHAAQHFLGATAAAAHAAEAIHHFLGPAYIGNQFAIDRFSLVQGWVTNLFQTLPHLNYLNVEELMEVLREPIVKFIQTNDAMYFRHAVSWIRATPEQIAHHNAMKAATQSEWVQDHGITPSRDECARVLIGSENRLDRDGSLRSYQE